MSPLLASLLHSLWIGLLLWCVLRVVLRGSSLAVETRHALALSATILLFVGWGAAWVVVRVGSESNVPGPVAYETGLSSVVATSGDGGRSTPILAEAPTMVAAKVKTARLADRITEMDRMAVVQLCLEWAWGFGVCFGLVRLTVGLRASGGRWLGRQSRGELPEAWLVAWRGRLEKIADGLKTRLIAIEAAGAPMVVGLLEPVIVVPLASCAGVSPEMARAALAHELAHVARRDWLVEIGLRVVEAVLFFNPFVWLLAAQVREEREACCDAWACERLEMPRVAFAESLASWARCLAAPDRQTAGVLGLGRGLLRRVTRLLGQAPAVRTRTWRGTAGVLALVVCGLAAYGACLCWGAWALSDTARVALLNDAAAPYLPSDPWVQQPASEVRPERIVTGRVVDESGWPVGGAQVSIWTGDNRTGSSVKTDRDGKFKAQRAFSGPAELRVRAEGLTMRRAYVQADTAELPEAIVLPAGLSVPIRVLDEEGKAVHGARVDWSLDVFPNRDSDRAVTQEDGRAMLSRLPTDMPVYVRAEADGFAAVGIGPLGADELAGKSPLEVRLIRGRSIRVRVISDETGQPVERVRVRVESLQPRWSPGAHPHPSWNYGGIVTDGSGEVVLKYLRPDTAYRLRIAAPGMGEIDASLSAAPSIAQEIRLPKKRQIVVVVKNVPEKNRNSTLSLRFVQGSLNWEQPVRIKQAGDTSLAVDLRGTGPIRIYFADALWAPLAVRADSPEKLGETVVFDFDKLPADLRGIAPCRVAIRFMDGRREVFPSGRFFIHRKSSEYVWDGDYFGLEQGKPLYAEWPAGTRLKLTEARGMIGAIVDQSALDEKKEIMVTDRLTEIVVPVKPAGLVRAQVRDAEGRLLRAANIMGSNEAKDSNKRRYISFDGNQSMGDWKISGSVGFSFWGTPIWAADGLVFAQGPSVKVSAGKPVVDVVVTLPKTRVYRFFVTDQQGRPLPSAACTIRARFDPEKYRSVPFGILERISAADGSVSFEAGEDFLAWDGLNLMVEAKRMDFASLSTEFPVARLSGRAALVMTPSTLFRARIVDPATGKGIPGITLKYFYTKGANNWTTPSGHGVVSDAEGWFAFTDMEADRAFRLNYSVPYTLGSLVLEPEKKGDLTAEDSGAVIFAKPLPR